MASDWIGYAVSVRCGSPLGCYQGTILSAGGDSLTLTKPFRNGFPYPKSQVTLKASDIKSLEIIEGRTGPAPAHSTVPVSKRRAPRATVCEDLQASGHAPPSTSTASIPAPPAVPAPAARGSAPARSKPIDIQGSRQNKGNQAGSYGASGSTPKTKGGGHGGMGGQAAMGGHGATGGHGAERSRRRNEACFGDAAQPALDQDFDFEGNLALFDKEALWQQMRPDVVRVAAARDEAGGKGLGGKLRHDQNVLRTGKPDTQPVQVPLELRGPVGYVTDEGVSVPSVCAWLRRRLWGALARGDGDSGGVGGSGGALGAALALLARAAADVALRLVGGTRRLDPRNAHQRPACCVLAGGGVGGAAALLAARLLLAHGVRVCVYTPPDVSCALVAEQLALYCAAGGRCVRAAALLPAPDLALLALHDPATDPPPHRHRESLEWARSARAVLLLLEPPGVEGAEGAEGAAHGDAAGGAAQGDPADAALWRDVAGSARAAVAALLPPALCAPRAVFLANVAPPPRLFTDLGLAYRPPFGASAVLALHPDDDST